MCVERAAADQLLCTKRRWGLGGGLPEAACFVNGVVSGSVEVRPSYEEYLAQGLMEMADVYCKCGTQVGYKFCADKTPTGRNQNQVGRYGLVCSRFTVAAYQLSHSRLHTPESLATPPGTKIQMVGVVGDGTIVNARSLDAFNAYTAEGTSASYCLFGGDHTGFHSPLSIWNYRAHEGSNRASASGAHCCESDGLL